MLSLDSGVSDMAIEEEILVCAIVKREKKSLKTPRVSRPECGAGILSGQNFDVSTDLRYSWRESFLVPPHLSQQLYLSGYRSP